MANSSAIQRELAAGVAWGMGDDVSLDQHALQLVKRGMSADAAEREARWIVELHLFRQHYRQQVTRALSCSKPAEKRALYAEWVSQFGKGRAERFARILKHEKALEAVLKW